MLFHAKFQANMLPCLKMMVVAASTKHSRTKAVLWCQILDMTVLPQVEGSQTSFGIQVPVIRCVPGSSILIDDNFSGNNKSSGSFPLISISPQRCFAQSFNRWVWATCVLVGIFGQDPIRRSQPSGNPRKAAKAKSAIVSRASASHNWRKRKRRLAASMSHMAVGQNLRYLFCRVPYHLFKRLLRVTGGTGF